MSLPVLALPTHAVGPVPFRVAPFGDAVAAVVATRAVRGSGGRGRSAGQGVAVHFANAYTIALADSDPAYAELLARPGSAVFTDGVPVAWVGKRAYPELARFGTACTARTSWRPCSTPRGLTVRGTTCWAGRRRPWPCWSR